MLRDCARQVFLNDQSAKTCGREIRIKQKFRRGMSVIKRTANYFETRPDGPFSVKTRHSVLGATHYLQARPDSLGRDYDLAVAREFGVNQIGLNPSVTDVDVGRLKQSRTKIRKFVRDISRTEQNLPCRRLNFLLANGE